jgi:mRNA (guanine-N7-)-methyltransferase
LEEQLRESLFDVISIQFALHYAFSSEQKARSFFQSVGDHLVSGGYFYGTIPYSPFLLHLLEKQGTTYGNSVYNIEFKSKEYSVYGQEYTFTLLDAIDACPEYIVHPQNFISLCKEYGLDLVLLQPFHDFFYDQLDLDGLDLISRMGVFQNGGITKDEWEASGLYSCFCFRKQKQE